MVRIPNGCSIFQLRPDQSIVGSLSYTWHFVFYILFHKPKSFVGSARDPVYKAAPEQVAGDNNPKIFSTGNSLQDHTMQYVGGINSFPGTCPLHLLALWLHVPVRLPHRQSVQILLKHLAVISAFHGEIHSRIVSEKTHLGSNIIGQVIDVDEKQDRS